MNDLQQQVKNISQQGRFGDTTLVHMSPAEVRGLAQMGQLTTNPNTGLAEAFSLSDVLAFAAPIVGGIFGGPMGAALASGAVTTAQEGSLFVRYRPNKASAYLGEQVLLDLDIFSSCFNN